MSRGFTGRNSLPQCRHYIAGISALLSDPCFNLEPRPNQAGLIGWLTPLFNTPVYHVLSARTGTDYGLDVLTDGIEQILPIVSFEEELWGVPAEPIHNPERFGPGFQPGFPSNSPAIPFLQNPTTCTGPLSSTLDALSYDGSTGEANGAMAGNHRMRSAQL